MTDCIGCQLVEQRTAGKAAPWDSIYRTDLFDVVHSYGSSLLGWMIIKPLRHVESIAELTEDESKQMGHLMQLVSKGLTEIVACQKTYVMQFAEAEGHQHVHFHVVPRHAEIADEDKGPDVFNYMRRARSDASLEVSEAEKNEFAAKMSDYLRRNAE